MMNNLRGNTWSTNCGWPRFPEEAKNGPDAEKEDEGTKKLCWLEGEGDDGLNDWEGLNAGGGELFGLNADRNISGLPPSLESSKISRLSLKAGKRVSGEEKREGQALSLSPLEDWISFLGDLASHGRPTLTSREGRREFLNIGL